MKAERIEVVELEQEKLDQVLARAQAALSAEDFAELGKLVKCYQSLLQLIENKSMSIARLKQIIFGSKSEKTSEVFKTPAGSPGAEGQTPPEKKKRAGHGRNGSAEYSGAEKIKVPHPSLQPKNICPECAHGKLYAFTPTLLVRITGQAPLQATIFELAKLRCNGCGHVFQAPPPKGVEYTKHDASAAGMIALLKYGVGVPFNRIEKLEQGLGIPLPAGTQWGVVQEAAALLKPAHEELIKHAAQGKLLHNDDTSMTVMELAKARNAEPENSERTGCFTTGIVSVHDEHTAALFFTGTRHAGENLEEVLKQRAKELGPPIQMCDALSRNVPEELKTILANCICHARRKFVEVAENFPVESKYLLDTLKDVYLNDATTKREKMSDQERLTFHQTNSTPFMDDIKTWAENLLQEKKIEPNSGLGQALTYMLRHWDKLTLFLRHPGAPLDNNICERALKKAILHRKNALFYLTANGAHVGDLFMSLIHTAELNHARPFDYLVTLLRHAKQVADNPGRWMPWNYQQNAPIIVAGRQPSAATGPAP